jgi:hypothetical protein
MVQAAPVSATAGPGWRSFAMLVATALLLAWFWHSPLLYPLRILVVLFHELGHAAVAVVTGGEVLEIGLGSNEGGHCITRGGWHFLILNGGYLGSLVAGLLLLAMSRARRASRGLVVSLGLMVLVVTLVLVRPVLGFGFGYGLLTGILLMGLGIKAPPPASWWFLRLVGVFSVLYALLDVRDDVFRNAEAVGASDATMLAEMTHIPAFLWGGGWILLGLGMLVLFRRRLV